MFILCLIPYSDSMNKVKELKNKSKTAIYLYIQLTHINTDILKWYRTWTHPVPVFFSLMGYQLKDLMLMIMVIVAFSFSPPLVCDEYRWVLV